MRELGLDLRTRHRSQMDEKAKKERVNPAKTKNIINLIQQQSNFFFQQV